MSKYIPCVQKPCCCSAACVKIALKRRGIEVEELHVAKALGTRITSEVCNECEGLPVNDSDPGLNLEEFESKSSQEFLAKYGLKVKIYYSSKINDLLIFLTENYSNDLIVNIHHKPFKNGKSWGHYVLVDSVEENKVTFCDPAQDAPKHWTADVDTLKEALSDKNDGKERGIAVISKV